MSVIRILHPLEIREYETPPLFDSFNRKKFLTLPAALTSLLETSRHPSSKIALIVQCGYFRACHRFFGSQFRADDLAFVAARLNLPRPEVLELSKQTLLRQREAIAECFGARQFQPTDRRILADEIAGWVRNGLRPSEVFRQSVSRCRALRIVLPNYNLLATLISEQVNRRKAELNRIINESMTAEQKLLLDNLLTKSSAADSTSNTRSLLTLLKQPSQSLKPSDIKANLNDWQHLQTLYQKFSPVIAKLNLSAENLRYHAQIVLKADLLQIARRAEESRYLHLLAFIAFQTFRYQDVLVDSFLQSVQTTINSATQTYRDKYFLEREEKRRIFNLFLQSLQESVLPTLTSIEETLKIQNSNPAAKLLLIETAMSLNESERRQIEQQTGLLLTETGNARNSGDFYDILQKQSLKLQKRAADIVRCLRVDETQVQPDLFNALQHFQRRDGQIEKNAPQEFLSKQEKDFLNLGSAKFPVSLYKVLLFQQLSVGIKSGTVNFSDSHKYRSLDDYLISREFWQQHRAELLGQADLQESDNFPAILTNLSDNLHRAFQETNRQLKSNRNPHLKFTADRDWVISTPKQDATLAAPLKNYFPSRQLVPLSEVLSSVNQAVPFLDEFSHWQTRRRQSKPVNQVFFAGIIGTGCELGIGKMAFISKHIGEIDLENTVNWYFSPENLQNANAKIVNFLNNLELPNLLRRSHDRLHTSSDGQKYGVCVPSLNANHSFKYFGHDKGVTVYSFIDERHLLFYATVISAAEREAAYVIDGLLHNEVIKSDIHSTDSHGFTEIVFGVTHLLGFSFAPRLKQLSRHRLYSFEKRKVYENIGCQILPKLYIDTKLIEDNWDDVLRFVATIKLKHTTASQLFRRLNSYSKQHPLYQALKEFGKIIKTLFILRYIDDVELRQAIEKQLNKIEHAHRFAKAVAFANNQEFSEGEKELQNVAADCRRLIENSIICWNYLYLTNKLTEMPDDHQRQSLLESIKAGSIITWKHINFHGEYDFSTEKMQDSVGLNLPKILAWKAE